MMSHNRTNKRIVAIIPARGGSKRLPGKNIFPLNGKPLLAYTIEACRKSEYVQDIYVSSDNDEILAVAEKWGAKPLRRPQELADDTTPKVIAIRHAVSDAALLESGEPDIVLIAQANSPQITAEQIDRGFSLMFEYDLWEVMSADQNGVQNAAFRIVTREALFQPFLSAHCGFVVADNIDVHTIEDIEKLSR
ncbi:MAG: N-acylneuraminate cytidylyltransferase [Bacteroidota bacterium]|jgi:CMP-N-acetylneuraminic acid synthetase